VRPLDRPRVMRTVERGEFPSRLETVANFARCSHGAMGAPVNTLARAMSLRSRIATSTVCKDNKHANARKQNVRAGMDKARAGRCRACAHEGHAQVGVWRAHARNRYAHAKGFVEVNFVDVDCVVDDVCGNMHNAQSKARASGLCMDRPGYCIAAQVGNCCASARCLSLSWLITVASHRYARTRPVFPWALPCGAPEGSWIS